MLELKLDSLYEVKKDFKINLENLGHYINKVESRGQGFMDLAYDLENLEKIQTFAGSVVGKYQTIVILGIGGSMLGPKTILEALYSSSEKPKVICIDNIDPYKIQEIESALNYPKTLFLVQTKSGGTPETVAQYLFFRDKLSVLGLDLQKHFVFVTDPEKGLLREIATQENITSFSIPASVGGRFSVLSSVGLLVSALVGLNLGDLLLGARDILENQKEEAYKMALVQYELSLEGKNINVIMPYSSRLSMFAQWCIQLISESLGKAKNLQGEQVNAGITPVPATGATDQHSQLQLFSEGPKDKLVVFINIQNHLVNLAIPNNSLSNFSYLNDKSFNQLLAAELVGVRQSLEEASVPSITINIEKVDEYHLGSLFMFFEMAIAFLGEMLEINTFDQPGVERSKVLTKETLEKN